MPRQTRPTLSDPSEMSDPSSPGTNHGKENLEILEKTALPNPTLLTYRVVAL